MKRSTRGLVVGLWLFLAVLTVRAHPPLPVGVLDPHTAPEAWNVLRLATANIGQLLRENRLAEIPDQASLCSPALRALARFAPPGQQIAVATRAVHGGAVVTSLAQAAMAGDHVTADAALATLTADLHAIAPAFGSGAVDAEIYFCPMHPDFLSANPTAHCDKCGMPLARRDIPYSFVYAPPGEPTLRLTLRPDAPPTPGRECRLIARLTQRDGSPVAESDLLVTHTRPIHLLIVDPALEDYHHEHPVPTGTPGEYAFSFVPAKATDYRVFADVVPTATGVQEYPCTDLPGTTAPNAAPPPHGENTFACEAGGLHFALSSGDEGTNAPPQVRQVRTLRVTVSETNGQPAARLEPVMNAFAHLVGFYDDGRTVLHLHPEGGEITNPAQRGGPSLNFRFYPPKAGFVRLFCQVQINGMAVYAPFNVNVLP